MRAFHPAARAELGALATLHLEPQRPVRDLGCSWLPSGPRARGCHSGSPKRATPRESASIMPARPLRFWPDCHRWRPRARRSPGSAQAGQSARRAYPSGLGIQFPGKQLGGTSPPERSLRMTPDFAPLYRPRDSESAPQKREMKARYDAWVLGRVAIFVTCRLRLPGRPMFRRWHVRASGQLWVAQELVSSLRWGGVRRDSLGKHGRPGALTRSAPWRFISLVALAISRRGAASSRVVALP